MPTYAVAVEYKTKKGSLKTARLVVKAENETQALGLANFQVRNNGQRQVGQITNSSAVKQGFLARLFRCG